MKQKHDAGRGAAQCAGGDRGPARGTAHARKPDMGPTMPPSSRGRPTGEGDVPLTPRFYHHFDDDDDEDIRLPA